MTDAYTQQSRRPHPAWVRRIKRYLPRSLFGRTLLIIVTPTILALCVATFVFFNRHWYIVTHRLTHAVAGDVAMVVEMMRVAPTPERKAEVVHLAETKLNLYVTFTLGEHLAVIKPRFTNPLRVMLQQALDNRLEYPYLIDMPHASEMIAIRINVPEGVYTILCPERRIYTPTTEVFIGWMIGSSILLSVIALLFMRNQIRPIRRLAEAAESIGKGQDVPWFKIEGASEVRQASAALMVMRDRLRRQITQRMTILSGVSHDLRTPLTRMKLQLALMPDTAETLGFKADIADMESMLDAYLSFARGEESEPAVETDLGTLLKEVIISARREHPDIDFTEPKGIFLTLRQASIRRCIANLISNAVRYGSKAQVSVAQRDRVVDVIIDDDGPGIPPENREDVFRPYLRLDESRNPETGGVGLGLTIARDIARSHGGNVILDDSPLGGLRARVWLPM